MLEFTLKILIFGWRQLCLIVTSLIYRQKYRSPEFLLQFETKEQKRAYQLCNGNKSRNGNHRLLVVIPFRDKWHMTETCLKSLLSQQLENTETLVALVDNGSREISTNDGIKRYLNYDQPALKIRHLSYDFPFNFSKLNNLAVKNCSDFAPDTILLLNNDVELTQPDSIQRMINHLFQDESVGSVGSTLLYPDGRIQHLFVFIGSKIVGAHPFKYGRFNPNDPWYSSPRPVGASTGALLMLKAKDYNEAGGFDEKLANCYQDVDLALKLQKIGKANWVVPGVVAIHHETQTRSPIHSWDEVELMYQRWGELLTKNPYVSSKFSRWSEQIVLSLGEGNYPWRWLKRRS